MKKKIRKKKRKEKKNKKESYKTMKSQFSHGLILHFIPQQQHQQAFKVSITNVKWKSSKFSIFFNFLLHFYLLLVAKDGGKIERRNSRGWDSVSTSVCVVEKWIHKKNMYQHNIRKYQSQKEKKICCVWWKIPYIFFV